MDKIQCEINESISKFAGKYTITDYAGRLLRWVDLQEQINKIIKRHLSEASTRPDKLCDCPEPTILEKKVELYCTKCGRDMCVIKGE